VAEELAFEQRLRQRRAVDADECMLAATRVGVEQPRDPFFARPALARDEHGRVASRRTLGERQNTPHGDALRDELVPEAVDAAFRA